MKALTAALACSCLALAAVGAQAQDAMKKDDPMMKKGMTAQECKDHMAMSKKDGMKKDDAMMKADKTCADMMKKDGMMMKDGAASAPMMKK